MGILDCNCQWRRVRAFSAESNTSEFFFFRVWNTFTCGGSTFTRDEQAECWAQAMVSYHTSFHWPKCRSVR
jgi:hypothetical protein